MQLINNSLVLTQAYWVILTYSELLPYLILIQVHGNFKPLINGSEFEKWKKNNTELKDNHCYCLANFNNQRFIRPAAFCSVSS